MALGEDFEDDELLRLLAFMSAELFGEVKPKSQDPVGQIAGESGPISDTAERRHARGQIGTYSEVILLAGFRTGIFSFVVVLPNTGRLVYHDRGGMIFSDEFNFRTSGVLERYAVLLEGVSDAQRGRDTSVVMLAQDSPEALLALQILLEQDLPEGLDATDILPICTKSEKDSTMIFDTSAGDLAMMLVLEERKSRFHRIVVHRPFYCDTSGLTGEGTRHFYGIELDERILVHVQEDWRVTLDGMIPETDLYEILESQDVHYLPEHLFGGDVPYNTFELFGKYRTQPIPRDLLRGIRYFDTFTHGFAQRHTGKIQRFWSDYCKQPKDAVEILPRRLHRMVFKSIPLLLSKYKSTKQLAQVVRDAVQCTFALAFVCHSAYTEMAIFSRSR
ncbi:hypothetical protein PENSPDRAFT_35248 [Peniophora sp. CONT]|nr:hypothetical protein PENSPDRAFT_35248 [Peniophora sp. CONT]